VFIKKRNDLQHLLDHQAQHDQPVKLELSVKDEKRTGEFWFKVIVPAAQSVEECEQSMMNFLQDRIQDYSPT
jgi:hypothetical protein